MPAPCAKVSLHSPVQATVLSLLEGVSPETGLHAGAKQVLAWLGPWGGEYEPAAPVCHE